jgi:hypothetical protein
MQFLPGSHGNFDEWHDVWSHTRVTVDYYVVDKIGNLIDNALARNDLFGQQLHQNVALSR